jgi:hypothetical protein
VTVTTVRKAYTEGGLEKVLNRKKPDREYRHCLDGNADSSTISISLEMEFIVNKLFVFITIAFVVAGCHPSSQVVQTAIAKTKATEPTNTLIPTTSTPMATQTPTPIPTVTFTPTPTPDLRVIDESPRTFLILPRDIPPEGKYYLPDILSLSQETNDHLISAWGGDKGRKYILATERENGWSVIYDRGVLSITMPRRVFCNVITYKTAVGAQLSLTNYKAAEKSPLQNSKVEYYTDKKVEIGDQSNFYSFYNIFEDGENTTGYSIEFTYRNIMVIVSGLDDNYHQNVSPDLVEQLAQVVLSKLQAAPLIDPQDAVFEK